MSESSPIFHHRLDDFLEALECLYIKNNQSGRLQFFKEWQEAARHILGTDLLRFDTEGGGDLDQKMQAETQATTQQHQLISDIKKLRMEAAENGFLAPETLKPFIERWDISILSAVLSDDLLSRHAGTKIPSQDGVAEEVAEIPASQEPPVSSPPENTLHAPVQPALEESAANLVQGSGELIESGLTASREKSSSALMAQRIVHAKGFAHSKKKS